VKSLPSSPFIYPLTDRKLAGSAPIGEIIRALCSGGARLIQLREKGSTAREFLETALEAVAAARACGARLLVNDRVDIACLADADGAHLGDKDFPPSEARLLLGPKAIIGISCHSLEDVEAATGEPVDYIAVGSVFPTDTKVLRFPVVGTEMIRQARTLSSLPIVAIGGITRDNAAEVIAAGADGIALISELMVPGEIGSRTRELVSAIDRA